MLCPPTCCPHMHSPNLPPLTHFPCLAGYTEKGKSIADIKFEMKHVKKHVKYLKSMTKRWYCVLLKILTYLLSARFWLWRCRCCCLFAVRSFVCLLCNDLWEALWGRRVAARKTVWDSARQVILMIIIIYMALETCDRQQQQQQQETENREQKEQLLKTEQESREEIFCCVAGDVFRAASCFSNACGAHGAAHLTNAKYVDLGTARHLRVLKITYIHIYSESESERGRGRRVEGPLSWKSVEQKQFPLNE